MSDEVESMTLFRDLGLSEAVLKSLDKIGYESPTAIQAQAIPLVLAGSDLLGQAQTGTGKTGAFALPILTKIEIGGEREPQALVLVPTRELAIQVAEAFQKYAEFIPGFHVLPIYGGQSYEPQLRQLRRETHVIVGTPGRLADHLKRRTLRLDNLRWIVLDEADEMLRMGFIDEVEWILEQAPAERQVALFSATMPEPIRRIAAKHLSDPEEVTIRERTATASTIRQRYWLVSGLHKLDALTRILEGEDFDAMLVFVRTKTAASELAEKLEARGFACAPLSGDVPQRDREATVEALKDGKLDIIVATDVAARGLDVSRISHVVNYDIPYDTESYIHRIGRTGRAGRTGEAILFVSPRERRLLSMIEKATRQRIEFMDLPSAASVNDARVARFKQRILDSLAVEDLGVFYQIVEDCCREGKASPMEVAAALANLLHGDAAPFSTKSADAEPEPPPPPAYAKPAYVKPAKAKVEVVAEELVEGSIEEPEEDGEEETPRAEPVFVPVAKVFERKPFERKIDAPKKASRDGGGGVPYRVEVGRNQGVKPGHLVGAIANEAGLNGSDIGAIDIQDDFSVVHISAELTDTQMDILRDTRVCGRPLRLVPFGSGPLPAKSTYTGPSSRIGPSGKPYPATKKRSADDGPPERPFKKEFGGKKDFAAKKPFAKKTYGDDKPYAKKPYDPDKPFVKKPYDPDKPYTKKPYDPDKPAPKKFGAKKYDAAAGDGAKSYGDKKYGEKKFGDKKFGEKKFGDKKFGDKKFGAKKFDAKPGASPFTKKFTKKRPDA